MSRDNYKTAIILFAVQLLLMAVLVNSILAVRYGEFSLLLPEVLEPILGAAIFILSIASIFVIRNLYTSSIKAQRQKIEILRLKNIEEQNQIYRQHRHDLYNHLTVISGFAQLGRLENLREYLAAYLESINRSMVSIDTGLKELDILLYAKIREARDRGIEVKYGWAQMECCQGRIIGVVAILANALDNAIRACEQAGEKKLLEIKVSEDPLDYIIEITNTYDPKIDLAKQLQIEGFTSKPGSSRGEGVSIIRKTVKNLRGRLDYEAEAGRCRLKVELPKLVLEGKL